MVTARSFSQVTTGFLDPLLTRKGELSYWGYPKRALDSLQWNIYPYTYENNMDDLEVAP